MLGDLLVDIIAAPEVYKKIVGMQMLVEGLAMGAFANSARHTRDPLLKQLMQLVMTDEAFHHKFGKIWADRTIPKLSREEHELVEDWAAQVFQTLLFNLSRLAQRGYIYEEFGLDPKVLPSRCARPSTAARKRRDEARAPTSSACWSRRCSTPASSPTAPCAFYAAWVDMEELKPRATRWSATTSPRKASSTARDQSQAPGDRAEADRGLKLAHIGP